MYFSPKKKFGTQYVKFINVILDTINVFSLLKGFRVVIDNVPVHNDNDVDLVILDSGCIHVYLLIEMF